MKPGSILFALGFCLSLCLGADSQNASTLRFGQIGFSIAPLKFDARGATFTALQMFLPAVNNFASNVDVQVQAYPGTMEAYIDLSRQQLEQLKLEVIRSDKRPGDACLFEYRGQMGEQKLHFYARGILKSGSVYLATARTTEDQWSSLGDNLKSCVDSLQLDSADSAQP